MDHGLIKFHLSFDLETERFAALILPQPVLSLKRQPVKLIVCGRGDTKGKKRLRNFPLDIHWESLYNNTRYSDGYDEEE